MGRDREKESQSEMGCFCTPRLRAQEMRNIVLHLRRFSQFAGGKNRSCGIVGMPNGKSSPVFIPLSALSEPLLLLAIPDYSRSA